jgi:hypothetical protein
MLRRWFIAGGEVVFRGSMRDQTPPRRKFHPVYLLLALPFIADLWPPFYSRIAPEIFGIPFFYWWQTVWVLLAALCILPAYLYEARQGK